MPVNNTHSEYDAALPVWIRARDILGGEDAIKAAKRRVSADPPSDSTPLLMG